jgi:hypothetical protein
MRKLTQKIIWVFLLILFLFKDLGVFAVDYSIDFSIPNDYTLSNTNEIYVNNGLWQLKQQLAHSGVIVNWGATLLSWATDIVVEWNYAYITSYDSDAVEIVNISNPVAPSHVSSIVHNGTTIRLDGASGIVKDGNYLYVTSNLSDALQIIDVSNPASPSAAWQIVDDLTRRLDGARGITKSGNNVFIASDTDDALAIIDVTNPASPTYTSHIRNTTSLNGARGVKISGNYAFVTAFDGDRFTVINISNLALPSIVRNIANNNTTRKLNGAWEIDISGNYAYIAASVNNAVQILDITDPVNPIVGANFATTWWSYQLNGVSGVHYSSGFLYTAWTTNDAISIIDVSVAASPVFISSLSHNALNPLLDGVRNMVKVWNYIYAVSNISNALEILKINYPTTNPQAFNTPNVVYTGWIFSVSHTLWVNNLWNIRYQISKDGWTTWYYWWWSEWLSTWISYTNTNDIATINSNILGFHHISGIQNFKLRAYLNSNGTNPVEIDTFNFETDTTSPSIGNYFPVDDIVYPNWNVNLFFEHEDSESGVKVWSWNTLYNSNIAPSATITYTPSTTWWVPPHPASIVNGIKDTAGAYDYEYHSDTGNAFIEFEWSSVQKIWAMKIFNRVWCCSERLTSGTIQLYDASSNLLYTHTLWSTTSVNEILVDFEALGKLYDVKRLRLNSTWGNVINIREIEIYQAENKLKLQKWNGTSWWSDIAENHINFTTASMNSTQSTFSATSLSYGKYKASYTVYDRAWNPSSVETIFYVDEVEFSISSWSVDIGTLPWDISQFSTWELILTVKTVWAWFSLDMTKTTPFEYDYGTIWDWNGSAWFWYDQDPYTSIIQTINSHTVIASQTGSINTNGSKNTYTYKLKYGALVDQNQLAWNYATNISFQIVYNYNSNWNCIIDTSAFWCIAQ